MRIKEMRSEKGFTQKELAESLGVAESTVCCWETDKRVPTLKTVSKIAEVFGCTIDELLSQKQD